jgi:hypothetical protein
MMTDMPQKI